MGVQKYLSNCYKLALNGNLPLFNFTAIVHATPTQAPTHSQCLELWTQQAFRFRAHSLSFEMTMVRISNDEQLILPPLSFKKWT